MEAVGRHAPGVDVLFKRGTRFLVLVFVLEGWESKSFLVARFAGQGVISFLDRVWLPSGQQPDRMSLVVQELGKIST